MGIPDSLAGECGSRNRGKGSNGEGDKNESTHDRSPGWDRNVDAVCQSAVSNLTCFRSVSVSAASGKREETMNSLSAA
jgi:hypothetical protein